jgi:hypothetical protein
MASGVTDWRGEQILARVARASAEAIDQTTEEAAQDAAASHWWRSRSGQLEAEIISEPAEHHGDVVVGRFGSTRGPGFYGLILEHRTPFLRPAADRNFPKLAARIRARL